MGRVIGVFGKDIDSEYLKMALLNCIYWNTHLDVDNQLPGESSAYARGTNVNHKLVLQFLCGCVCITFIGNGILLREHLVCLTLSSVLGSVIIITIIEHYFRKYTHFDFVEYINNDTSFYIVIIGVIIICGYQYFAAYYRASAREVKRLGLWYCWSWSS